MAFTKCLLYFFLFPTMLYAPMVQITEQVQDEAKIMLKALDKIIADQHKWEQHKKLVKTEEEKQYETDMKTKIKNLLKILETPNETPGLKTVSK